MKTFLKIAGLFLFLILLLSVTVKEKPLFSYIYQAISPATVYVQDKAESFFASSFSSTQKYSQRLFSNSLPKVKDAVASKTAGPVRGKAEPLEKIMIEEKEQLDELIKSH